MFKLKRSFSLFLALIIVVLSFSSCGKKGENDEEEYIDIETTTVSSTVEEQNTDSGPNVAVNEKVRIGIVLSGKLNSAPGNRLESNVFDFSINNVLNSSNYLEKSCFKCIESVDPKSKDATIDALKKLVSERAMYIILTDPMYAEHIEAFAKENKSVSFMVYNYDKVYEKSFDGVDNISTYSANITGAEYLAGIVSAYKANELKSNIIGYLVGDSDDLTTLNAFAEGVRSVNSKIRIKATVSKNPKSDAQAFVSSGCKIIASDFYNKDIETVATSSNAYFCGFGSDQYSNKSNMLCAPVYDFSPMFINIAGAYQGNNMINSYKGGYATKATYISSINEKIIAAGTNEALQRVNINLLNNELDTLLSADIPISNIDLSGKVPKTETADTSQSSTMAQSTQATSQQKNK